MERINHILASTIKDQTLARYAATDCPVPLAKMDAIKAELYRGLGISMQSAERSLARLVGIWPGIVGHFANLCIPERIEGDMLVIRTTNALVAGEMQLNQKAFLHAIKRELPDVEIRRLRFVIG